LQQGDQPFENSLKLFAEAEKLILQSQQYLNGAELTIQHLIQGEGENT
jgi:exodeoxyribonuclease VII small subunit